MKQLGLMNAPNERLKLYLPNTFIRGKDATDHIWITPKLFDVITNIYHLPFNTYCKIDHRPLVIDINLKIFSIIIK